MNWHYTKSGKGPPLVLLHGWATNSNIWHPILAHLTPFFTVIAIDLPGFGQSKALSNNLPEWAVELNAIIPNQSIVIGWSLGALVMWQWLLLFPQRCRQWVSICASPCFINSPTWQYGIDLKLATQFYSPNTLDRFYLLMCMSEKNRHLCKKNLSILAKEGVTELGLKQALDILINTDLSHDMSRIKPGYILLTRQDKIVPIEVNSFFNALPHRDLHILESNHIPFMTHTAAVVTWFKKILS